MTQPLAVYRPMTAEENTMATALGFVRVPSATFDKRFVGVLYAHARDPEPQITEPQSITLRRLVHKYRRQLRDDVVALAGERPPDPWKQEPIISRPQPSREQTHQSPPPSQLSLL